MGKDKAILPLNGQAMSLALAERYKVLGPVAFAVDRKGRFPVEEYGELEDHFPGCGPLNGIISAFADTQEEIVFLTATDMPGGSPENVMELLGQLEEHDACIYRGEPLFGVYRRSCLSPAMECMAEGEFSMRSLLRRIRVKEMEAGDKDSIINLNTPEDFREFFGKEQEVF